LKSGAGPNYISITDLFGDKATRVESPMYVYQVSPRRSSFPGLPSLSGSAANNIAHLFGHMIGIAPTSATEEKLRAAGSKSFNDFLEWLYKGMLEEYQNNPLIEQYYRNQVYDRGDTHKENTNLDYNEERLVEYVLQVDEFRDMFKIPKIMLPDNISRLIEIYESFSPWDVRNDKNLKEIQQLTKTWIETPEFKKLMKRVKDNPLVDCINISQIRAILSNSTTKPNDKKVAKRLLLAILKG
jgi:hypothetical protein